MSNAKRKMKHVGNAWGGVGWGEASNGFSFLLDDFKQGTVRHGHSKKKTSPPNCSFLFILVSPQRQLRG